MFRGTTPTLYFKINNIEDLSIVKELNIIFKNDKHHCCKKENGEKLIKTIKDVTIDYEENMIILDLTQKETLIFKIPNVLVQIKFMFEDGKVCASSICEIPVEDTLDTHIMKLDTDNEDIIIPEPVDPESPIEPGDNIDTAEPGDEEENEVP